MAHTKSAEKSIKHSERSRISHKARRSELKTLEKSVRENADAKSIESIEGIKEQAAKMMSKLDKAVKSGTIHPNKVARKKSQISKLLHKKTGAAKS